MTRPEAIAQIREAAKNIALQFMKLHPAIRALDDESISGECFKAVHEMTVNLELIKKKISKLEHRDDSPEL
jgi:thymidylate synthase ThyX